jgi:hypothetical protein
MNIKAILASLILGSSSIAMASPAAPGVTVSSVSYGNTAIRDHRFAPPVQPAPGAIYYRTDNADHAYNAYNGRWMPPVARPVTLAAGLRLAPNSQTEIKVGAQAGAFTTLKLDATGGRSFIRQVYIQFENGQEQIIRNLDRTLTGNECLTLDLDGGRRQIHRVIVYGAQGAIGWRRAAGSFNVSAV